MEKHEAHLFIHVKELLYKHITDSHQKFFALVITKVWKYTVLVEAHDKLGHQGATWTYCLIKWQYYCKGIDTSYFLFKKVQLLLSKLSAYEFYFTSNNLMFVMRSYRVMWLVLLPAVWS